MQDELPGKKTLGEVGEDAIVDHLTKDLVHGADVVAGAGDDCAVIEATEGHYRLLKTDSVIEKVHFLPEAEPGLIGRKAAARVVSDFAAMGGGKPQHAMITLIAPTDRELGWVSAIYGGIERCAREFAFSIVGGETSRPPL